MFMQDAMCHASCKREMALKLMMGRLSMAGNPLSMTDRSRFVLTLGAGAIIGAAVASVCWWFVFLEPMEPQDVYIEHPAGTWWVVHPDGSRERSPPHTSDQP